MWRYLRVETTRWSYSWIKFISGKSRRSLDHPRAEILLMVSSYLKSHSSWPCSWSWGEGTSSFSPLFALDDGKTCHINNAYTFSTKSAFIPPVDSEWDRKISRRSFALSFWMSSRVAMSLSLYFKTILKIKLSEECWVALQMLVNQLFESAGSTSASLSCLRGYYSNMAAGTVKRAIVTLQCCDKCLSSTLICLKKCLKQRHHQS